VKEFAKNLDELIEEQANYGYEQNRLLERVEMGEELMKALSHCFTPRNVTDMDGNEVKYKDPGYLVAMVTSCGEVKLVVNKNLKGEQVLFFFIERESALLNMKKDGAWEAEID